MDEDLPKEIADLLTVAGHDPATVVEQVWQGLSDDELWPRVQNEERWLLTADKEFADCGSTRTPGLTHIVGKRLQSAWCWCEFIEDLKI